jgi:hypothetical protein
MPIICSKPAWLLIAGILPIEAGHPGLAIIRVPGWSSQFNPWSLRQALT